MERCTRCKIYFVEGHYTVHDITKFLGKNLGDLFRGASRNGIFNK